MNVTLKTKEAIAQKAQREMKKSFNKHDESGSPTGGHVLKTGIKIEWNNPPLTPGTHPRDRTGAFVSGVVDAALHRLEHHKTKYPHWYRPSVTVENLEEKREELERKLVMKDIDPDTNPDYQAITKKLKTAYDQAEVDWSKDEDQWKREQEAILEKKSLAAEKKGKILDLEHYRFKSQPKSAIDHAIVALQLAQKHLAAYAQKIERREIVGEYLIDEEGRPETYV